MPYDNGSFAGRVVLTITGIIFCAESGLAASASAQDAQRIRIHTGDQTVTATLNSSEAARDLVAMLPVSTRMRDHLRREKTGALPRPLSERTRREPEAGRNFVTFCRHDGLTIPSSGIVLLGRVDAGAELFDVPGAVEVTVELIK